MNDLSLRKLPGQTLLFDADDTLWKNNVYFERAIASFLSLLDQHPHAPEQVRERLNGCERATIAQHGYGVASFHRSLIDCFEQLTEAVITRDTRAQIVNFTDAILNAEIALLPRVRETLVELGTRHRLIVVTKGNQLEQLDKFERSGLKPLFAAVEVPSEKTAAQYLCIAKTYACEPARTWMIGNSPRSDINPALAAGLNTVFIPHPLTWALEDEVVEPPADVARFMELQSFVELATHF